MLQLSVTNKDTGPQQGVLYLPNIPWLEVTGHQLVEQLAAAKDAYHEHPSDHTIGEVNRLTKLFEEHVKVRIQPLSHADYKRLRQGSKAIGGAVTVKGSKIVVGDHLSAEFDLALELIEKRVSDVLELETVALDGTRTKITTGTELAAALRQTSAGPAELLIEDLHQAIKDLSHLRKGLGEALPSQFGS